MNIDKNYKAIDLFAGCGGLSLGLKQAGFTVLGAVEKDSLSCESYLKNHVTTRVWNQDIRSLSTLAIKRALGLRKGDLDLLAGCPPCQGFSSLVTNNGKYSVDDPRNSLIYEFLRFVQDFMPRAVLMENVPRLAHTTRFHRFCKRLERLGYVGGYRVLDAAGYGVPQRRKRLVYVAGLGETIEFATPSKVKRTVRDAFRQLNSKHVNSDPLHDTASQRSAEVQKLIGMIPKDGGSRSDIGNYRQLACHEKINGFHDVYGRMSWDDIAPTITSGCINPSKGRFLHPRADRSITLREAALLQTFPLSYKISLGRGKYKAAEMIGNAFPPEFAKRQAIQIRRYLKDRD